jgi:tRNA1(Val) A37 N6-methylase TrmN6
MNAREFKTFLVSGNGRSLAYLPKAPAADVGMRRAALTLEDAFPFTSILELRRFVGRLADSLYTASGGDRLQLFDTALTLLAMKFYDELKHPTALRLPSILRNENSRAARLGDMSREAFDRFGVGKFLPRINFSDSVTIDALSLLIPFSFVQTIELGMQAEILGTFYQEIVSSTFRGSLGAYFTPKPVADLAAELCDVQPGDSVFDISCGSGTFLLSAYAKGSEKRPGPSLFGCDIQPRMVLTATLNCLVHGVKDAQLVHDDGLRLSLATLTSQVRGIPRNGFRLIVGNPPFAGFDSDASGELPNRAQRGAGVRVHKVIPFVDRVLELLAPGGRAALVVPTSVLNGEAASFRSLRSRLITKAHVTAVVGLPKDAFVHTDCGVEGAVLFFKKAREPRAHTFYYSIRTLGYDRRGRATHDSDVPAAVETWRAADIAGQSWLPSAELPSLDRWDPAWLNAHRNGHLEPSQESHVRLTDLCEVVTRPLDRREVRRDGEYEYFEVGDADLDSGEILRTHRCSGAILLHKGRLRLRVDGNEVLLPNHRDSLVAKTAVGCGRSVVIVPATLAGLVTSDRFTPLRSLIDPRLLAVILNSRVVREQLVLRARGSASFDIREKVLRDVWVPLRGVTDQQVTQRVVDLWERREELRRDLKSVSEELQHVF